MNEGRPLSNLRILVTRPPEQARSLVDRLEALGAAVLAVPAIEIHPVESTAELDTGIANLRDYDILVLTSVNGVQVFADRVRALGASLPPSLEIAAIGPATAAAAKAALKPVTYVPEEFVSESVAQTLGDVRGKRILLPRADIARKALGTLLREAGADTTEIDAYRIVEGGSPETIRRVRALNIAPPHFITVTSSSTARGIVRLLHSAGKAEWLRTAGFACIGPITEATVRELGFHPRCCASVYTTDGLVSTLIEEVTNHEHQTPSL